MRNLFLLILLAAATESLANTSCGSPRVSVDGPNQNRYQVRAEINCTGGATGTAEQAYQKAKSQIEQNDRITEGPNVGFENGTETTSYTVITSTRSGECAMNRSRRRVEQRKAVSYNSRNRFFTTTTQNTKRQKADNGTIHRMSNTMVIDFLQERPRVEMNMDFELEVSGWARRFPSRVKSKLEEKIKDVMNCMKRQIEKRGAAMARSPQSQNDNHNHMIR